MRPIKKNRSGGYTLWLGMSCSQILPRCPRLGKDRPRFLKMERSGLDIPPHFHTPVATLGLWAGAEGNAMLLWSGASPNRGGTRDNSRCYNLGLRWMAECENEGSLSLFFKQAPHPTWSPMWGSNSEPWDQAWAAILSWKQGSAAQPTEPPRHPGSEVFLSCPNPSLPRGANSLNQVEYKCEMLSFSPSAVLSWISFPIILWQKGEEEGWFFCLFVCLSCLFCLFCSHCSS